MLWIHYIVIIMGHHTIRMVVGKYANGHLVTHENWAFVARFCFLSDEGKFEYEIEYDEEYYGTVNLLLYYDSETQWPGVYKTNKTCLEKESALNIQQNQIVNLTSTFRDSGCVVQKGRSTGKGGITIPSTLICKQTRRFRSSRERWWFIAISNCKSQKGLNIRFKFLMTNGPPGDYWHEHLSADEFYILPILMSFTLIYMLMILAIVMISVELKARQFLHATYKLFIVSVSLQELGIMAQSIHYVRYAVDGLGYPRMKNFGRVSESASEICFLLLLLLLAKGYTVTRGRLRLASSIKMTIFMCLYVVCYTCLFIYEREFFDPGEVLYIYESPAGYGLITLRIVAWWMFIYSTVFTLKHYPEKATFYYPFNVIGTLWFVAGPGVVLAANNLIDKWVRESIVCGSFHGIAFGGHVLFLILTLPSKANKNFPYHVRTNQIGMMEITGVSGNNSIYQFGHHPYAPGGPTGIRDVPLELFTVSRHLDIRAKAIDYETQPFPHDLPPGYSQTILLPITIRSNSNETTPESSGYNTPRPEEVEDDKLRTKSAMINNSERMVEDERKAYSANCERKIPEFQPSAPSEDITNTRDSNGNNSNSNSRPDTASTVSIRTAMKNREMEMSVEKLTDMFIAQSHKKM